MESIILSHAPEEVVKALLIQLGVGTLPISYATWPVFTAMEPDKPDNCITLYNTDGIINGRTHVNGEQQEQYGIQVRVRGATTGTGGSPTHGSRVARNIIDAIVLQLDQHVCLTAVTLEGVNYIVHAANRHSGVLALGRMRDNSERYLFTVNYIMSIAKVTT